MMTSLPSLPADSSPTRRGRVFRALTTLTLAAFAVIAVLLDDTVSTVSAANAGVLPISVSGTVLGMSDGHLAILEDGAADPVAFLPDPVVTVTRDGDVASLDALAAGDRVRLMVDARSGHVLRADASAVSPAIPASAATAAMMGLLGATLLLAWRERATIRSFDAPVAARALSQRIAHACAAPVHPLVTRRAVARC